MHPAFSVIFFTTLSGLGYGVWVWSSLMLAFGRSAHAGELHLQVLVAAAVPVVVGLLSSTLHLGKPQRAWRAFSQWRTSWLSREGVLAVAAFVPWLGFALMLVPGAGDFSAAVPWVALLLAALSLATVASTAMIYASLVPIPAWRHALVLPGYLGFALLTGGLVSLAWVATGETPNELAVLALLMLAIAMMVLKRRYWRDIDRGAMPATRASALGLAADRVATVFERPHTEANYLTREMGYVLARKHAVKLRRLAVLLFAVIPALACALVLLLPGLALPALALAAFSALLGAMVERWLFFAQAKHAVMLYY